MAKKKATKKKAAPKRKKAVVKRKKTTVKKKRKSTGLTRKCAVKLGRKGGKATAAKKRKPSTRKKLAKGGAVGKSKKYKVSANVLNTATGRYKKRSQIFDTTSQRSSYLTEMRSINKRRVAAKQKPAFKNITTS